MMSRNYRISDSAQADLKKILIYTQNQWGKQQAIELKNEFIQQIHHIAENPYASPLREDLDPTKALRFRAFMRWHIVYRGAEPVDVLAFLDSSRDIPKLIERYNREQ
jgi:plasmid stabilization system protein ParE